MSGRCLYPKAREFVDAAAEESLKEPAMKTIRVGLDRIDVAVPLEEAHLIKGDKLVKETMHLRKEVSDGGKAESAER